ncbi:Ferredoxin-dependent glutamate synthase [Bathymodiolus heckerae thiotrophic gill symbiont]|uniref:FMN-binding glutamate synthase family protein n=1 Tax=Bathymodiolus heckerae thiotrophic gill symbiont TaxID=1052212 RepID=UPI0010B822BA|nr:FMN-binding glutamate synthase family protein [Bathymodiolus heckerae thiotrophic gill symbiont]CAC9458298.1 Ferredoxin-dependent glutamate synthase (EC 1.4.7.1) [uncultured Gammaproteobacteria bacterium]SMN13596.1 Ferredoxin-dependent glutamate synthase [Bathymodiolus heckerae thiotrophic gill symbiont]
MDAKMMKVVQIVTPVLEVLSTLFVFMIGLIVLVVVVTFIFDITQRKNAILRNYPVIGHFRSIFSNLGEFFRQYFFAMDREEMPFNRAERDWVHRAANNVDTTVAFGSTKNLNLTGTVLFANCPFPTLDEESMATKAIIIGKGFCKKPYKAKSIFNISGMSFGAISKPAVLALSNGAKMANCWYNTGEGGLSPYHLEGGADIVFQIGTAKYGVRDKKGKLSDKKLREIATHNQVKMFEIKMSQGAKPGKGGILPSAKVTQQIAQIRGIGVGQDSISPNRHVEVNSTTDLLDMINRVREVTGKPVGFKTVIGATAWLDDFFQEINKRGEAQAPDFITLDSGDGGTGAAPMSLLDNVGLPIKETLPLLVDKLNQYNLKQRIKVITSGKLITPTGVAWALCTGADFVTSARGFMFSIGCIQALKCNKNTCPTGITTHNKRLQKGLNSKNKTIKVANYVNNINHAVEIIAHSCGVKEPRELNRTHIRIVQNNGKSVLMSELYPQT